MFDKNKIKRSIIRDKVILATNARAVFAPAASIFCSLKATSGSRTSCLGFSIESLICLVFYVLTRLRDHHNVCGLTRIWHWRKQMAADDAFCGRLILALSLYCLPISFSELLEYLGHRFV